MANAAHLQVLSRGVEAWNLWRSEHPEIQPDLERAGLRGRGLSGARFDNAILLNARLQRVRLVGAHLNGADLRGARLGRADLGQAHLREARLGLADLSDAVLAAADLRGIDGKSGNLRGACLAGADLRRADLRGALLHDARLDGCDLAGSDLGCANLSRTHLEGANLRGARLVQADLRGAHLSGVELQRADLEGAYLEGACLRGAFLNDASLRAAHLERADLSGADLRGVDLTAATFGSSSLGNVDLSLAIGLEEARHRGPSTIGIDTLYLSRGQLPEAFLRGAGVPESLLEVLEALVTPQAIDFYSCFISYSHSDKPFARWLHDRLQARGIRCWLDEYQMLPGDDFYQELESGIRLWDKVLLCCSRASLNSWWVDYEIETAFEKERRMMRERRGEPDGKKVLALIPLDLDGFLKSGLWKSGKAEQVRSRLAADFTGWQPRSGDYDGELERIVKALRADSGGRQRPPLPKL